MPEYAQEIPPADPDQLIEQAASTQPAEPGTVDALTAQLNNTAPITDLFVNMFLRQLGHKSEYDKMYRAKGLRVVAPEDWGNLNDPQVQAELRSTLGYMTEEMYEAVGLLKNKPWKNTPRETDHEEFYKEVADAIHFFLEFLIISGMTPDLVARYYFGVAKSNDDRRENGY